jgi:phage baseplate assembly protein W
MTEKYEKAREYERDQFIIDRGIQSVRIVLSTDEGSRYVRR